MRNKSFNIIAILSFVVFSTSAQERKKINFDDNWTFSFGHANDPLKDYNYSIATLFSKTGAAQKTAIDPKFNDSNWRRLSLPHDWAVELPFVNSPNFDVQSHGYKPVGGSYPETSIGWYRKKFTVTKTDSGQRFQVQFDGVFRDASFWVNGFYLGNNKSGYVGCSYDISNYLQYGKENVLVVRADATQYEGWFYEGAGIYRHVWLNQYHPVHLAENPVFVYTTVQKGIATVSIETDLQNESFAPANITVSAIITDRDGRKIGQTTEQNLSLNIHEQKTLKQKLTVSRPRLWSLEDPIYTG